MAPTGDNFIIRLEKKIRQQLKGKRIAYLLGAGASYLDGNGYPLAAQLWEQIRENVHNPERSDIQTKLEEGAEGLEKALDLLDDGGATDTPHRHCVTDAISGHFSTLRPSLDIHAEFVRRLSHRTEEATPIFSLNYDPLLERAAERDKFRLIDGFVGWERAYFEPSIFQKRFGFIQRNLRALPYFRPDTGTINLFKLHGSVGWYECPVLGVRRGGFDVPIPSDTKRLMIPPQHRKATDTMAPPYSSLWSEFRGAVGNGPTLINRLALIGYGMQDEHVNAVIENGLGRSNFTLMVFAKNLLPEVFRRWSQQDNTIIITNDCCSLYGEIGPGHPEFWKFEYLSSEV